MYPIQVMNFLLAFLFNEEVTTKTCVTKPNQDMIHLILSLPSLSQEYSHYKRFCDRYKLISIPN